MEKTFNISVSHISIYRWIRYFSAFFKSVSKFLIQKANLKSDEWHADETYIKIKGIKHYLWILLDSETRVVIAFYLSDLRNSSSAYKLFRKSLNSTNAEPITIVTDRLSAYNMPISMTYSNINLTNYSNWYFTKFLSQWQDLIRLNEIYIMSDDNEKLLFFLFNNETNALSPYFLNNVSTI